MKEKIVNIIKNVFILIILTGLIFSLFKISNSHKEELNSKNLEIKVLRDKINNTIEQQSNMEVPLELSKEISSIRKVLEQQELENRKVKSLIFLLRKEVLKYRDTITNTIVKYDTIDNILYPTYYREITNEFERWTTGSISLGKSEFNINLETKDSIIVTSGIIKDNLFSKPIYYTKAYNLNPYIVTDTIQAYANPKFKETFDWKSTAIGVGIGILTGILIKK
jgi:hypothetical protein